MKIFCGNIPFSKTTDELFQLFEQFGQVHSAEIARTRENNQSKGFAFIEFIDDEQARRAIEGLNGYAWEGRRLYVSEKRAAKAVG